ncbi:MAG: VTT domain-containing protein [Gammaproteobacteria bacterium]|nr:VTT domain-containing protein [Gammaproteobacteria bacterium]
MNKTVIRLFIFLLIVTGMALAITYRQSIDIAVLESWVNNAGMAGPLVFMLLYIVGTVFFFPGSVLTLAGGALFGPLLGTFINLTAATIGAIISFIAARYLAHDWVEKKTGGRLKSLKQGVEDEGWKFVAFVRLVPLFPFNLLNYALGLTKIKLSHYSIATYICMLPGAIAYSYIGYLGREALAGDEALIQKIMIGIALLAMVAFLPSLIARLRAKPMLSVEQLKQKLDAKEKLLLLDVRPAEDFIGEQGHIEQAKLMPLEQLAKNIDEIDAYRQLPVLIICRTDRRSAKAAKILVKKGFTNVQVVQQGMTDWNAKAFPVSR